jgi:hypothetical protein
MGSSSVARPVTSHTTSVAATQEPPPWMLRPKKPANYLLKMVELRGFEPLTPTLPV